MKKTKNNNLCPDCGAALQEGMCLSCDPAGVFSMPKSQVKVVGKSGQKSEPQKVRNLLGGLVGQLFGLEDASDDDDLDDDRQTVAKEIEFEQLD
ncbi:MAG: hypothetical protein FWD76_00095 [Firmicutes bacterium]|nr:hypothetical protein [Bacillota bacterium]